MLHDADLVAVAAEQTGNLLVVHAAKDGPLADLESVGVQDGDDGPRFAWVEVLDGVPCSVGRGLCKSI